MRCNFGPPFHRRALHFQAAANTLGKPVGRAARGIAHGIVHGLYTLVTDLPGAVEGTEQTLIDVMEDPEAFIAAASEALDKRAEFLGKGDKTFGYNQMLLEVAAGEILTLGAGKLTKTAALRLIHKARIKIETIKRLRANARIKSDVPGKRPNPTGDLADGGEFLDDALSASQHPVGSDVVPSSGAWTRAYQRGEIAVDPNTIRFTQRKAGGGKPPRAHGLRESLSKGWNPDFAAIDVIETPDGLLSLDNTRVAIAQEKGLSHITARVRQADELLPPDFPANRLRSFKSVAKELGMDPPRTWGDLFNIRTRDSGLPPTGTTTRPRLPE